MATQTVEISDMVLPAAVEATEKIGMLADRVARMVKIRMVDLGETGSTLTDGTEQTRAPVAGLGTRKVVLTRKGGSRDGMGHVEDTNRVGSETKGRLGLMGRGLMRRSRRTGAGTGAATDTQQTATGIVARELSRSRSGWTRRTAVNGSRRTRRRIFRGGRRE